MKSLIDSLRPSLVDAKVADLFAGHGRFGIAALEEGASEVYLVEKEAKTAREIELPKKLNSLKSHFKVVIQDVFTWLDAPALKFDIVFADPPFELWNQKFEADLMERIAKTASQACVLVIKFPKKYLPSDGNSGYIPFKTTVFGDSKLVYYKRS